MEPKWTPRSLFLLSWHSDWLKKSHPAASPLPPPPPCPAAVCRGPISPEPPCPWARQASASLRWAAAPGSCTPAGSPQSGSPSCSNTTSLRCWELWWWPGGNEALDYGVQLSSSKVSVCCQITNLNTVQHPQHSWESSYPLELLERLPSTGGISVWGRHLKKKKENQLEMYGKPTEALWFYCQYVSISSIHFRHSLFYLSINLFLLLCELFPQFLEKPQIKVL